MPVHAAAPWTPGWSWSVEPEYGRPRLDVDMHIAGGGSGNVFVSSVDASLERSESLPGIRLEGANGPLGFLVEVERWRTHDQELVPFITGFVAAATALEQTRGLAAVTYRPAGGRPAGTPGAMRPGDGWTLFLGVRATAAKETLSADFSSPFFPDLSYRFSQTLLDAVVGARFEHALWRGLDARVRADAGAGMSKRAWNAAADLGWRFGPDANCRVFVGYRATETELTDSSGEARIEATVRERGGMAGVRFRF